MALPVRLGLLIVIGFAALPRESAAAPGDLDPSFGVGGEVRTPLSTIGGLALDSAGRILVAGLIRAPDPVPPEVVVARYSPSGLLDPAFGDGGLARVAFDRAVANLVGLVVHSDDKPLLAVIGEEAAAAVSVIRLTTGGGVDTVFGTAGAIVTPSHAGLPALFVAPDDRILVTRSACENGTACTVFVDRYTPEGRQAGHSTMHDDLGFIEGRPLLQPDGRLIVAGRLFGGTTFPLVLGRFAADGRPDHTFGNGGTLVTDVRLSSDYAPTTTLDRDGKLVIAGTSPLGGLVLARFGRTGRPDRAFGSDGVVEVSPAGAAVTIPFSVEGEPDGRPVVVGVTGAALLGSDWMVAAFTPDGMLDGDFGTDGFVIRTPGVAGDGAAEVALQADGRPIAAGYADGTIVLARYLGPPRTCGDADGDTDFTVTDGVQVLRAAADLPSACLPAFCDSDASGAISVSDGVRTLRAAAGLATELRCPP